MPLTINVGLSRKQSENYNSHGASINLTAELDAALLTRPAELQAAVSEMYQEASTALDRQAKGGTQEPPRQRISHTRSNGANGNGQANGRSQSGRGMTKSQGTAIFAIAKGLGIDPVDEARHEFGIDLERASISEASKVIDHLKGMQTSNTNGSRR